MSLLKWWEEPLEPMDADRAFEIKEKVEREPRKRIIGQERVTELVAIALFSGVPHSRDDRKDVGPGHILFSEVPGTGKTDLVRTIGESIDAKTSFLAMHPEIRYGDLFGGDLMNKKTGDFFHYEGPIYSNILILDELNRGTPKGQAPTLQTMEERVAVTSRIDMKLRGVVNMVKQLYPVKDGSGRTLFWVLSTINPIEQEGTYPIPEAQLDRFLFRLNMDALTRNQEMSLRATNLQNPFADEKEVEKQKIHKVANLAEVHSIIRYIGRNMIPIQQTPNVNNYMQSLIENTRPYDKGKPANPDRPNATNDLRKFIDKNVKIGGGCSNRVNTYFEAAIRTMAFFRHQKQTTIDEIRDLAIPALAHRLQLTMTAKAKGISQREVMEEILKGTKTSC